MRVVGVLLGIGAALALQTVVARYVGTGIAPVDLVLVAVVYAALTLGPVGGLLTGSLAGLLQDALSSGVIGIGGLVKSVVGFGVGVVGRQFILTTTLPRLVAFVGATVADAIMFMGLYVVLGLRTFPAPERAVVFQAFWNTIVGMLAFSVIEAVPGFVERRRARRRHGA